MFTGNCFTVLRTCSISWYHSPVFLEFKNWFWMFSASSKKKICSEFSDKNLYFNGQEVKTLLFSYSLRHIISQSFGQKYPTKEKIGNFLNLGHCLASQKNRCILHHFFILNCFFIIVILQIWQKVCKIHQRKLSLRQSAKCYLKRYLKQIVVNKGK